MSTLLRHPHTVPALFSRAAEAEPSPTRRATGWRQWLAGVPGAAPSLGFASAWAAAALVDVTLVRAAAAAVGFAPH